MGELRGATAVVDRLATRGVDIVNVWEQAYHNRIRRGTADGRHTVEAHLNHVCDRLAGHAVLGGRDRELNFYGGRRPQRDATHYFTTGGVPILGDPFERIKAKAHAVAASRALEVELSQPASKRTHASRLRCERVGLLGLWVCGLVSSPTV
eukprot:27568-Prymnesium_polylepis.1